jgi:hypothetical protein
MRTARLPGSVPSTADELEQILGAVHDRLEILSDDESRERLERGRAKLEQQLARLLPAS